MKTIIFITIAALGLALFAIPDAPAQAWWSWYKRPDLNLRGSGAVFITSSQDGAPTPLDGQPLTVLASGITKGSGSPVFFTQGVFEQYVPDLENCPEEMPLRGNFSGSSAFTFRDRSVLSLSFGPGSFCCSDGTVFECDQVGTDIVGIGRFKDATGTFKGTIRVETAPIVTFETIVDLD